MLNEEPGWGLAAFPSYTGILGWVQKSGYASCEEAASEDYPEGYALIVDESMMIGSEKLLLSRGVPSVKSGASSLRLEDIRVLDMEVKKSWNSEAVKEESGKVENRMGALPAYAVSDNAGTISKAVRDKAYSHVRDVGHSFGLFLQQVYEKNEIFKSFMQEVVQVKFREIMRPTAYLLPPKQHTISRFMNLSETARRQGKRILIP